MTSSLDENDQKTLIELFISDPDVFTRVRPILKKEYFDKKFQQTIEYLLDFSNTYNTLPSMEQLNNETRIEWHTIDSIKGNEGLKKSVLDSTEEFCKRQALEIAILKACEKINKGVKTGIDLEIKEAQMITIQRDLGIDFWEGQEEWLSKLEVEMGSIPTGWNTFDEMLGGGGLCWGNLVYVVSCSGGGKCEKKGTPILMFDKTIKPIEDIKVGDKLMGIDNKPRIVKYLSHGFGEMFDIHQQHGDDFTVTRNHTLSVMVKYQKNRNYALINPFDNKKYYAGDVFNITVDDYLKTSASFKKRIACWKADISDIQSNGYKTSSFVVKLSNETEYFGFELEESDQLYLHSDLTVTHNSLCLANLGLNFSCNGLNVLYLTLELDQELVGKRIMGMASNIPYRCLNIQKDKAIECLLFKRMEIKPGMFRLVNLRNGSTINDIEALVQELEIKTGKTFNIIVVDYADLMKCNDTRIDPNNVHLVGKNISESLRAFARERTHIGKNTLIITASQIGKDAMSEEEYDMNNIAGSVAKTNTADLIFSVRTNLAMKQRGEYQLKVLKARNAGCVDKKLKLKYNVDTLLMSDMEEVKPDNPLGDEQTNVSGALSTLNKLRQIQNN